MPESWGLKGEEEEPKKKKKEEEPILDFEVLQSEFERQSHRAQNDIDQRFIQIGSVIEDLRGNPESTDNLGLIGDIREEIRMHSLTHTRYGRDTVDALKKIERVLGWSVLYAKQMEGYVRAFQFYCDSAFEIINIRNQRIRELEEAQIRKVARTKDEIVIAIYNRFRNEGVTPSLRVIADVATKQGFPISHMAVKRVLDDMIGRKADVKQPLQEDTSKPDSIPPVTEEKKVTTVTNQQKTEEKSSDAQE